MPNRPPKRKHMNNVAATLFSAAKAVVDAGLGDVGITITRHSINIMGSNKGVNSGFDVLISWKELALEAERNNTTIEQFLLAVMIANVRAAAAVATKKPDA